jgi:hypothetical protein
VALGPSLCSLAADFCSQRSWLGKGLLANVRGHSACWVARAVPCSAEDGRDGPRLAALRGSKSSRCACAIPSLFSIVLVFCIVLQASVFPTEGKPPYSAEWIAGFNLTSSHKAQQYVALHRFTVGLLSRHFTVSMCSGRLVCDGVSDMQV